MERDAIAGVGFDLDHTIAIDNKLERVAFLRLLELVCADGGHALGTLTDEIDHIDALLAQQRGGAFSIDDAVQRFVLERGVSPKEAYVERFRTMAVEMADQFIIALPGAKRTFDTLRERGIPIAVLSNGWNPLQIRKAQCAGFDGVVLASADIGQQKPGARAFEALLGALGTTPANTWYVGDDPHGDVTGATDAGLHAVWIDADRKTYPPDLPPPRYTIHALEELLAIVPSPARISP
jgi:HAD superfamily hydrolase (TIGR01509 family)